MKRDASKRDANIPVGRDTDQSFRVCKVDLATLKIAINKHKKKKTQPSSSQKRKARS